ncbi:MAG TPA: glycosyltransferase family 2 protein [Candidatus Omnitrophota bacterium]|nr:glycosyltransferase family 2 protein [Candidatus Omnitrophota bacterium]HPT07776.1 glycosyltransferase family 2 protein [Candidatus Omnitrophota bacterium]
MPLLTVIVPAYNEEKTIRDIIEKISKVNIDKEIIVIDNGSQDQTGHILRGIQQPNLKVIHHVTNRGKGGAVLTGLSKATGRYIIIQDADLEYDPQDYGLLLQAAQEQNADLVLGARFTKGYHGSPIPRMGNCFLTAFFNILFGAKLNDCLTCYKLFPSAKLPELKLTSMNFDIEIEIVSKAMRKKFKTVEVPISYMPRKYTDGKKIRWGDGIKLAFTILKFRFS